MQNILKSPDYLTARTGIFLLPSQRPGILGNIPYYGLWPVGISVIFSWQNTFLKMEIFCHKFPFKKNKNCL
jgi:hypothetical protein